MTGRVKHWCENLTLLFFSAAAWPKKFVQGSNFFSVYSLQRSEKVLFVHPWGKFTADVNPTRWGQNPGEDRRETLCGLRPWRVQRFACLCRCVRCVGGCVWALKIAENCDWKRGKSYWVGKQRDGKRYGRWLVRVGGTIWWLKVVIYTDSLQMSSRPPMVFYWSVGACVSLYSLWASDLKKCFFCFIVHSFLDQLTTHWNEKPKQETGHTKKATICNEGQKDGLVWRLWCLTRTALNQKRIMHLNPFTSFSVCNSKRPELTQGASVHLSLAVRLFLLLSIGQDSHYVKTLAIARRWIPSIKSVRQAVMKGKRSLELK